MSDFIAVPFPPRLLEQVDLSQLLLPANPLLQVLVVLDVALLDDHVVQHPGDLRANPFKLSFQQIGDCLRCIFRELLGVVDDVLFAEDGKVRVDHDLLPLVDHMGSGPHLEMVYQVFQPRVLNLSWGVVNERGLDPHLDPHSGRVLDEEVQVETVHGRQLLCRDKDVPVLEEGALRLVVRI